MTAPLRIVALLAPRWCGATALAAELSALAAANSLPRGVLVPTDGAWFGRFRDGVTVHPELVELSGASRDTDAAEASDAAAIGPVVRRDGVSEVMRARPPQARQVVRDRLRRIAEDARTASAHTVLLVAPGAAWRADPAELSREFSAIADRVDVALLVRAPERALASALAHAVRSAEVTGARSLTVRAALADASTVDELAYGELLHRWRVGTERTPLLVPADRGVGALWDALSIDASAANAAQSEGQGPDAAPSPTEAGVVLPPLARDDLAAIAALAGKRPLTRSGRAAVATALDDARSAADGRAHAGALGQPHAPFAFADDEVRTIRRRFRRELEALSAATLPPA
ncbi:MAG TPA: hypothetical protein VFM95_00710 [Microcella sp.]|nr:hypothetical protein [Microcella sp.]